MDEWVTHKFLKLVQILIIELTELRLTESLVFKNMVYAFRYWNVKLVFNNKCHCAKNGHTV